MRQALLALPIACALLALTRDASAQDDTSSQAPAPPPPAPAPPPPSGELLDTMPPPQTAPREAPPVTEEVKQKLLFREDGLVLGLDFAFGRAVTDAVSRLNAGSPSYLPIGLSASFRTSQRVHFGLHGHFALASRDDCFSASSCTGRDYSLGAHVESALGSPGTTLIPWFRYGLGWEMLYRGGIVGLNDAAVYRHALDFIDIRFGGDFVVHRTETGKTTRVGPFVGMITGITVGNTGSYQQAFNTTRSKLDAPNGDLHLWFLIGLRATTDP